jgi:hypothetical protein
MAKKSQSARRAPQRALPKKLVSAGCDMNAALLVGGAYVGLTWYLLHSVFGQKNPAVAQGLAYLGIASQMIFLLIITKQRSLRAKLLGLPKKLPLFKDHEDAAITTYDMLLLVIFFGTATFAAVNYLSSHHPAPLHPLW